MQLTPPSSIDNAMIKGICFKSCSLIFEVSLGYFSRRWLKFYTCSISAELVIAFITIEHYSKHSHYNMSPAFGSSIKIAADECYRARAAYDAAYGSRSPTNFDSVRPKVALMVKEVIESELDVVGKLQISRM
jgi:hypothetical protein